jgi:hypothetical protein
MENEEKGGKGDRRKYRSYRSYFCFFLFSTFSMTGRNFAFSVLIFSLPKARPLLANKANSHMDFTKNGFDGIHEKHNYLASNTNSNVALQRIIIFKGNHLQTSTLQQFSKSFQRKSLLQPSHHNWRITLRDSLDLT